MQHIKPCLFVQYAVVAPLNVAGILVIKVALVIKLNAADYAARCSGEPCTRAACSTSLLMTKVAHLPPARGRTQHEPNMHAA